MCFQISERFDKFLLINCKFIKLSEPLIYISHWFLSRKHLGRHLHFEEKLRCDRDNLWKIEKERWRPWAPAIELISTIEHLSNIMLVHRIEKKGQNFEKYIKYSNFRWTFAINIYTLFWYSPNIARKNETFQWRLCIFLKCSQ